MSHCEAVSRGHRCAQHTYVRMKHRSCSQTWERNRAWSNLCAARACTVVCTRSPAPFHLLHHFLFKNGNACFLWVFRRDRSYCKIIKIIYHFLECSDVLILSRVSLIWTNQFLQLCLVLAEHVMLLDKMWREPHISRRAKSSIEFKDASVCPNS